MIGVGVDRPPAADGLHLRELERHCPRQADGVGLPVLFGSLGRVHRLVQIPAAGVGGGHCYRCRGLIVGRGGWCCGLSGGSEGSCGRWFFVAHRGLDGGGGPGVPALAGQNRVRDLHLLLFGGFVGGGGVFAAAEPVPGLFGELQTAEESVAGVDGPVAARFVLSDLVPVRDRHHIRCGRCTSGWGGLAWFDCSCEPRHGVNGRSTESAAVPHLEVQVRPAWPGGVDLAVPSDVRDVLAGGDFVSDLDQQVVGEHVAVDGRVDLAADVVVEHDPLPEPAGGTGLVHRSVGGGVDRLPVLGAVVLPLVHGAAARPEG